jgi:hypothetical protein
MARAKATSAARRTGLPRWLRPLFWEYRFDRLRWERDQHLVIGRVLASGEWTAVQWLRRRLGPERLREWLVRRRGAGLAPRQLRFWELILELPPRLVNEWLADPGRQPWDRRGRPS